MPLPAANPASSEQETTESGGSFYFNKFKKKKTKVNHEEWHDKLSQSINSFMTTETQCDKELFKKLFGEKSFVVSADDDTIVIKVRKSGEHFFRNIRFNFKKVILNYSERVRTE